VGKDSHSGKEGVVKGGQFNDNDGKKKENLKRKDKRHARGTGYTGWRERRLGEGVIRKKQLEAGARNKTEGVKIGWESSGGGKKIGGIGSSGKN